MERSTASKIYFSGRVGQDRTNILKEESGSPERAKLNRYIYEVGDIYQIWPETKVNPEHTSAILRKKAAGMPVHCRCLAT